MTSSLTYGLFRCVLFDIQVFRKVFLIFMYLVFNLIPLWSPTYFVWCWIFLMYYKYGLSWWMFYVYLKRTLSLLLLGAMFYNHQWTSVIWWCCSVLLCLYWFSMCTTIDYWESSTRVSEYNCGFIFSFQLYQFMFNLFWRTDARYTHI